MVPPLAFSGGAPDAGVSAVMTVTLPSGSSTISPYMSNDI